MHLHRPNTFDATAAWGPYLNAANAIGTERGNVKECQLLNSTDPVEQRTASRVFVYDVTTYKLSQLGHYVH